jgi:hypothetical protein
VNKFFYIYVHRYLLSHLFYPETHETVSNRKKAFGHANKSLHSFQSSMLNIVPLHNDDDNNDYDDNNDFNDYIIIIMMMMLIVIMIIMIMILIMMIIMIIKTIKLKIVQIMTM